MALVLLCALLAGCQWVPSVRYDGGNSGFNAADRAVTPALVNGLQVRFKAPLGNLTTRAFGTQVTPVYVNGHVIVPATGKVLWFDAAGLDQCAGTPNICAPQWSGDLGAPWWSFYGAEVAGNVVYVMAGDIDMLAKLFAFDLAGQIGCTGVPRVCQPLWTADVLNDDAPTVAGGKVFAFDMHGYLTVFDAAGQERCGGTPKVCQRLWTTPPGNVETPPVRVASVGGRVYVADKYGRLTVTDAAGVQGCADAPKVCQPLWTTAPANGPDAVPSPVVSGGRAFVLRPSNASFDRELVAFDAAGVSGCGGTPKVCQPLWSTPIGNVSGLTALAVANGKVYVPDKNGLTVKVFDASGSGCTGVPMTCPPLFTFGSTQPVTIANGLALQSTPSGFKAYDANGVTNCTAGVCAPVAQAYLGPAFNGFVTGDGKVFGVSIEGDGTGTLFGAW
jgi:outer membrane protein assembly factor BamB